MKHIALSILLAFGFAWPVSAANAPTFDSGETVARIAYSAPLKDLDAGSDFTLSVRWPHALIQDIGSGKILVYDLATNRQASPLSLPKGRFRLFVAPDGRAFMLGETSVLAFDTWASAQTHMEKGTGTPKNIPLTGVAFTLPGRQYQFKVGPTGNFFIHDRSKQTLHVCAPNGALINSYPCPTAFEPTPDGGYTIALNQHEKGILIEETPVVSRSSMGEQKEAPGISRRVFVESGTPTLIGIQPDGTALLVLYPPMPEDGDTDAGVIQAASNKLFQGSDAADIRMVVMRVDADGRATPFVSVPIGEPDGTFDIATGSLWHLQPSVATETLLEGLSISRKQL